MSSKADSPLQLSIPVGETTRRAAKSRSTAAQSQSDVGSTNPSAS